MSYFNQAVLFPTLKSDVTPAQMVQTIFATNESLQRRVLEILEYTTVQVYNRQAYRPTVTSNIKKGINTHLKNFYGSRFKIEGPAYYGSFRCELQELLPKVYRQYQLSYA